MSPELISALSTGGPIAALGILAVTWIVKVVLPWQREVLASNATRIEELEGRIDTLEDHIRKCEIENSVMRRALVNAGLPLPEGP